MIFSERIIYRLYFIFICLTYTLSLNIIPPLLQWGVNKLWIFTFLFLLLLNIKVLKKKVEAPVVFLFFLIFCYFIFLSLSAFVSFNTLNALTYSFIYGFCYFSLFLIFYNLKSFLKISDFFYPFILCSLFILIISFMVYLGFKPTFYLSDQEQLDNYNDLKFGSGLIGFSGVYLNQNSFSIVLLISIISIYSYILSAVNVGKKYINFLYLMLIVSFLFLFLTMSRGAIFSLFLIIFLYFFKGYKNKSTFYIFGSLIAVSAILYLFFYQYIDFFINRVQSDGTSSRSEIWVDAFNVFTHNFLFGVGDYKYITKIGASLSAHNVYLNKLASEGIFSFFFWFSAILIGIYFFFRKYIFISSKNKIDIFLVCSFMGILVHQIFENTIANTYTPFAVFFIMLLIVISSNKKLAFN